MKRSYVSTKLEGLELAVFRRWRDLPPSVWNPSGRDEVRVLLSVSGGADSMALARVLIRLKTRLKLNIEVATIHHGSFSDAGGAQLEFRDQAQALVVREIQKLDPEIRVHCLRVPQALGVKKSEQSEAAMRKARWEQLSLLANLGRANLGPHKFDWIAFGHHEDDLLETRLIRLLRGTGLQGLRSMKELSIVHELPIWRPLLTVSALEVREYLSAAGWRQGAEWLEDPSNQEKSILRNRIRHELLPLLEDIREGGLKSLKRSLENIASETTLPVDSAGGADTQPTLVREELMNLSPEMRRQKLSHWLNEQSVRDYSKAHIDEALKRLDTRRKRLKFELCGRVWIVDTRIQLATPSQSFSNSTSS